MKSNLKICCQIFSAVPRFRDALACLLTLIGIKVAHGLSARFDCLCAADAVKYFICCQLFALALCSFPSRLRIHFYSGFISFLFERV